MSEWEDISSGDGALNAPTAETRTITRADLAEALHQKMGLGRAKSAKYVEMVLDEIFTSIVSREDVKLSSFGAFLVRAKRERQGRNPKTGTQAKITARLVVSFKPSNVLRSRINNGGDGKADGRGDGKGNGKGNGKGHDRGLGKGNGRGLGNGRGDGGQGG